MAQREGTLVWQEEYGAFSFGGKRLPNHIAYVERQREHHAADSPIPVLERTVSQRSDIQLVRESTTSYLVTHDDWWQELAKLAADDNIAER